MKKFFALCLLGFVALGMAVGEQPEWITDLDVYVEQHYKPKEGQPEYMYYYVQNREFAKGRSTAKRFAEDLFARHFMEVVYSSFDSVAAGTEQLAEISGGTIDVDDMQVLAGAYKKAFEGVTFSNYEFLKWYYEETYDEAGKKGYTCFVLGRVPKKAISDMLLTIEKKAEDLAGNKLENVADDTLADIMRKLRSATVDKIAEKINQ